MKKIMAMLLTMMLLLSLAACADKGTEDGNSSKTVSMADFMDAFRKAGYEVGFDGSDSICAEDFGIEAYSPTSCSGFAFGFENSGMEKDGVLYYFAFANKKDAEAAFDAIIKLMREDGVYMKSVSDANGKKSKEMDDEDPYFGSVTVLTQVENTLVFSMEEWDIDVDGYTYDKGMENILEKMGY